jgi:hypothetical protein
VKHSSSSLDVIFIFSSFFLSRKRGINFIFNLLWLLRSSKSDTFHENHVFRGNRVKPYSRDDSWKEPFLSYFIGWEKATLLLIIVIWISCKIDNKKLFFSSYIKADESWQQGMKGKHTESQNQFEIKEWDERIKCERFGRI